MKRQKVMDAKQRSMVLTRRAFIGTAVGAAAGAVVGERWGRQPAPAAAGIEPFALEEVAGLARNEARGFAIPNSDARGVVIRVGGDRLAAYDRRCPHLGCPVRWAASRGRIECPCHNAVFEAASGGRISGPAPHGLRPMRLEKSKDGVWVTGWDEVVDA